MEKKCQEYCTGCGLCYSIYHIPFEKDRNDFMRPKTSEIVKISSKLNNICPFGKNGISDYSGSVWGKYEAAYRGHAADENIRYTASSGGVITAICVYLLEKNMVDGVILTRADENVPYRCETFCARTIEDVLSACGSRYSQSNPLMNITTLLEKNEKYCFVGKPCDVSVFRRYLETNKEMKSQIACMISFFCAGMPTERANKRLLVELGCNNCKSLRYRGCGWPGMATATDENGNTYTMDYQQSWMEILGRDIKKTCKFCFDGIGEYADISCGDIWNLTDDRKPDFSDQKGYNIFFTRTKLGEEIVSKCLADKSVFAEKWESRMDELRYSQPNHYLKRTTALGKYVALKVMFKTTPNYSISRLYKYAKHTNLKNQFGAFKGTIKRCIKYKI